MIETLIITILGNLIVLGAAVGITAIYFKKKAEQIENSDSELPIQDIFSEFLKQSSEVFKKELESESVQVLITTSVMEGVTALFSDEQNQTMLTDFISLAVKESISGFFPEVVAQEPLTTSEVKAMDKKSDTALGAITVNAISESLPPGYGFILDKIYPNWQEDAQKRPREFIALVSKAREFGLFNLVPGMGQGNASVVPTRQQSGF